jgi:bilin biosynthesis protein
MWELVENCDETTIPHLMSVLDEEDTTYRRAAVKTLGAIGMETVPFLVDVLSKSDNATVRSSCAKALAQVAINYGDEPFPKEGINALNAALNDINPVVSLSSAMALGTIGVPALDGLLDRLSDTDNPALAVAIVNAVSSIQDPRSEEVLARLANDESADSYVREMATSALSRLELVKSQLTRD